MDSLKDDDSDLSNDTPLSELIKQETSAKQLRSQQAAAKEISSTSEQPDDDVHSEAEQQIDQPTEHEESEQNNLSEEKIEDSVDLIDDSQAADQEDYMDSIQSEQSNNFDVKSSEMGEKPKVEIEMPIDSFESDSNEEKSMENIQRKIEELPELKDSNSSENSQDEKIDSNNIELIDEQINDGENLNQSKVDEPTIETVEPIPENADTESVEQINESIDENELLTTEKDENMDTVSINDEITDLTTTKDEAIEHSEPEEISCEKDVEKDDSTKIEKVDSMNADSVQIENVESSEQEPKVEPVADSTTTENVVEILDDDILDEDDCMQDTESEIKREDKTEIDSIHQETDDLIEIKSDDGKQEESLLKEKEEKAENPLPTVKIEEPETTVSDNDKEKSATPAPSKRKASTDDEFFEDAKETLENEVKPPKPATPAIACDTDDDSPIEVVKEEKVGVKRDYSRRKKDQSHSEKRTDEATPNEDTGGSISSRLRLKDRDRSESPYIDEDSGEPSAKNKRRYSTTPVIDSLPNSPASSDDRDYRSWKKSILLLYTGLSSHRCASTFAKPITEEQAPNYKRIILNPMDLQSLKRNIDSGQIRTTIEFQRYVMLMCYNAIFYNVNDDITCTRAKDMLTDALQLIAEFSVTWKKDSEKPTTATSTSSNVTKSVRGRKSNRLNI